MSVIEVLTHSFLIAMPQLEDRHFSRTVTYICDHSSEGTLGIIINRPFRGIRLGDVFSQMGIDCHDQSILKQPVFRGGPMEKELGFVLHQPKGFWQATHVVQDDIAITTSRDVLISIAQGKGPTRFFVAFGYAGWGAGQIEAEILENSWLHSPADPRILFDFSSEHRWKAAASLLGIEISHISMDFGSA